MTATGEAEHKTQRGDAGLFLQDLGLDRQVAGQVAGQVDPVSPLAETYSQGRSQSATGPTCSIRG